MCGISGWFDMAGERGADRALAKAMNDAIAHRGPDGEGFHFAPGLALGHRRLAIIDLQTGDQPMFNRTRTVAIVFNGEIYNFRELRAELTALGHRFETSSDTEAIIHAWEEWGEDTPNHLTGMFAFALWDERRRTLFLARDRLGEKPLYYSLLPDKTLIFGSELKALLAHEKLARRIDPCARSTRVWRNFPRVPVLPSNAAKALRSISIGGPILRRACAEISANLPIPSSTGSPHR
jgi:asparagine synthase (glutamine-hydrolysing)